MSGGGDDGRRKQHTRQAGLAGGLLGVRQVVPWVLSSAHSTPLDSARWGVRGPSGMRTSVSSTAVRCRGPPAPPSPETGCQTSTGEACQRQRAPAAGRGGEAPRGWPDGQALVWMRGADLPGCAPASFRGCKPAFAGPMAGEHPPRAVSSPSSRSTGWG